MGIRCRVSANTVSLPQHYRRIRGIRTAKPAEVFATGIATSAVPRQTAETSKRTQG